MPTVPKYNTNNIKQQKQVDQTLFQQANTPTSSFGGVQAQNLANAGQVLEQASDSIMKAEMRVKAREDAVNRTNLFNEFNTKAQELTTAFENEQDATNPEILADYNIKMDELKTSMFDAHSSGTENSRFKLGQMLDQANADYRSKAVIFANQQQKEKATSLLQGELLKNVQIVREDPSQISNALQQGQMILSEFEGAFTPQEELDFIDTFNGQAVEGAMQYYIDRGAFEQARDHLRDNPSLQAYLTDQQFSRLKSDIDIGIRNKQTKQSELMRNAKDFEAITGQKPSVGMMMSLMGVKDTDTPEMKNYKFLQSISQQYGEDSPQYRQASSMMNKQKQQGEQKFQSDIGKLHGDRTKIEQDGVTPDEQPALDAINENIEKATPSIVEVQEKQKTYVKEKQVIESSIEKADQSISLINEALKLTLNLDDKGLEKLSNEEDINKIFQNKGLNEDVTGWDNLKKFIPATQAAKLQALITPLLAKNSFSALQDMRDQSPTGGALGQVTVIELFMLQQLAGTLNFQDAPEQSIRTLLQMREKAIKGKSDLVENFDDYYSDIADNDNYTLFNSDGSDQKNNSENKNEPKKDKKTRIQEIDARIKELQNKKQGSSNNG